MSRPSTHRVASNLGGGSTSFRSLEGKLAIITGGSRGIGAAVARNLARKGCSLVLNYTSDSSSDSTQTLAETLSREHDISALAVQADMGSATGPAHVVNTSKNHFAHPKTGHFRIDIIVNNAGVSSNAAIADVSPEHFHSQYNINVLGPLLLVQAALPYLPTDRSGRIVNVSSTSASQGFATQSVYGGTKAALEAMTRTWARELAERATVNAVTPGPVSTDMWNSAGPMQDTQRPFVEHTPLAAVREQVDSDEVRKAAEALGGRPAYDHEIAGVIGMLCSDESGWSTGSVVCANGGMRFST
ncbi:MAG: hypothetical protein M1825_006326 [Sarcosagium campestre]|nr:MAG: hypothetical protein M1825_006326 [Sarcosagium campestre]